MDTENTLAHVHRKLSRRFFVGLGAAGVSALRLSPLLAGALESDAELDRVISELEYLTRPEDFGTVERGNPLPYTLPREKRLEVGLERETWQLEVIPDPETEANVRRPLSRELGTALDWKGLMALAGTRSVRYLKIMTCLNIGSPLGMGLWEGVPLRDVIWMTDPISDIRRVFYHGYHNEDPAQLFESSLPIGRVLEDPPGEQPVILCYKLNGEWLSGKRGGPVRMLVPEDYGFKSIKWLKRVVLTNRFNANDTYERGNNDIDTRMKTFARFVSHPAAVRAAEPIPITGLAQVGISGLKHVQYSIHDRDEDLPEGDPHFTNARWVNAEILGPPAVWGGGLPGGRLPPVPQQFDTRTGQPRHWPMRNTKAHWAALIPGLPAGEYDLRCRTIDASGIPQPMPRPFRKSGRNSIESVRLSVEA